MKIQSQVFAIILIILAALACVVVRATELAGLAEAARPPFRLSTVYLLLATYAAALSAFVTWRVPGRAEAHFMALYYAITALGLAAAVTPLGTAEVAARAIVVIGSVGSVAFVVLFASRFPRHLLAADFDTGPSRSSHRSVALIDRFLEPFSRVFITRPYWIWGLLLAFMMLVWSMTAPDTAHRFNLLYVKTGSVDAWRSAALGFTFMLVTIFPVALVWSGYRRAADERRRQSQWLVLGALFLLLWIVFTMSLHILWRTLELPMLEVVGRAVNQVSLQVMIFVVITAPFIALLYGGAMDIKPVITRTSIYGIMIFFLTVLFAGVEQLVSTLLTDRLGLPAGTGSILGATAVALAMMPLQERVRTWLKRLDAG